MIGGWNNQVFTSRGTLSLVHIKFNNRGYERAIIDTELMIQCDEKILTGANKFRYLKHSCYIMLVFPKFII